MLPTDYKRLFLRGLKWDAEDQDKALIDMLKVVARGQLKRVDGGQVVISTSGNGRSTTFATPQGEITPVAFTSLLEELLRRYDEAKTYLIDEEDIAEPTDDQIFDEMLDKLEPVTSASMDFSECR